MLFVRPFLIICFFSATIVSYTQPKLEIDLKKPKEFEDRKLGSEKMAEKKFTIVRRVFQNTFTHYNYHFNANNLINEIIFRASAANKDDYTELLTFYPWLLENTSTNGDIDSVLEKCTAGILLHDLRNDWIDNMYLLMGKAYYLRKDFDSAAMAFQYLNYAFSPKDKSGSDKTIGSNAEENSNAFSIVSKEKKRSLKNPPSRNDGFVWQVRNYTDRGDYIDASSLISVLRNDPNFPKRLEPPLNEAIAYLNYKQGIWDSAAVYLEKSMSEATDPTDKARRWFLAGQLYQMADMGPEAANAYSKSTSMALDPVMEVYARLNSIRLRKAETPAIIDQNLKELLHMAKRDKYTEYRDIIYYAAGLFELERDGYDAAAGFLEKSIAANTTNTKQKSLSFLLLGDVRYAQKAYGKAGPPYDSLTMADLKEPQQKLVEARKPGCIEIFKAEAIIEVQDSLLALAAMPENERIAMVKGISKQLRKQRGLKEEESSTGSAPIGFGDKTSDPAASLFSSSSGTWYFYEPTIRANGFNGFKERWGARPNVDNWRRTAALGLISSKLPLIEDSNPDGGAAAVMTNENGEMYDSTDISFDNLYSRIPLSDERKQQTNARIIDALYKKAESLHNQIEDYPEAIKVYEEILRRQDTGMIAEKSLFALVHCYTKVGDLAKAKQAKDKLQKDFANSEDLANLNKGKADKETLDRTYKEVYSLFIEGRFDEALSARKRADSILGDSYWTPQLLYIQSIYHIKKVEDSLAIGELTNINNKFANHGLSKKATVIIDVLKRRKEIEAYLTKLEVTRDKEDGYQTVRPTPPTIVRAEPPPTQTAEEKAAAEKALLEKMEADRLKAQQEMAAFTEAQKLEAEKEAAKKAAADKLLAEKAEAERLAAEKAEAAKAEADRIAAEKAEAERIAAEEAAAAKALAEKQEAERIAAEKALAEKIAAEKAAEEQALAERQAAAKAAEEKALAEKQAAEKAAEEKALAEKQAADKLAREKALAEKQAKEKEAMEKEAKNKEASENLLAKQKAEQEAMEQELAAQQKAEKEAAEKALAEKQAQEKAAEERKQQAKESAEKLAAEKALAEKLAAEKQEAEKALTEKLAADKLASEKALADKIAAEKAETARIKQAKEAEDRLAKERAKAQKEAEEKAELARTSMVDNVLIGKPTTPSPFTITANEPQVVAIILERIDPAYVNEVSYGLSNASQVQREGVKVEVIKKKIKDNLWLVELHSPAFTNMQAAYNYIQYLKPLAQSDILNWLDASKYQFITISKANLQEIEKSANAALYYQVLKEAIPGKF